MSYFRTCPHCGAALDPGERCDCEEQATKAREEGNANEQSTEGRETAAKA